MITEEHVGTIWNHAISGVITFELLQTQTSILDVFGLVADASPSISLSTWEFSC